VCGIVLFRAVIVLLRAIGVVLVVDTCCTIVVSVVPIFLSFGLLTPTSGIKAWVRWYSGVVRLFGPVPT
jgi:hypothetical protein